MNWAPLNLVNKLGYRGDVEFDLLHWIKWETWMNDRILDLPTMADK